jgi:AcrR family transcriptional regulator
MSAEDTVAPVAPGDAPAQPPWAVAGERPAPVTARGQRTRQRVLEAAEELFRAKPLADVSVSDIAARSSVSIGSFYRYFTDKEEIFLEILSGVYVAMYEQARNGWDPQRGIRENLHATTRAYLTSYYRNREIMRSAHHWSARSERARNLVWACRGAIEGHMLTRLVRDQELSSLPALDPLGMMRLLSGMVDEYARRAYAEGEFQPASEDDIAPAARVLGDVWLRAIFGSEEP